MYIPVIVWRILTPEEKRRLIDSLLPEGGEQNMKAKSKGLTKNQKLKLKKTAKSKKLLKK